MPRWAMLVVVVVRGVRGMGAGPLQDSGGHRAGGHGVEEDLHGDVGGGAERRIGCHWAWLPFLTKFRKSGNMSRDFRKFWKSSEFFGNLGRIYWVTFFGG